MKASVTFRVEASCRSVAQEAGLGDVKTLHSSSGSDFAMGGNVGGFFGRTEPYRFHGELRGPSAHLSELR
jgi:hypothetical protein